MIRKCSYKNLLEMHEILLFIGKLINRKYINSQNIT